MPTPALSVTSSKRFKVSGWRGRRPAFGSVAVSTVASRSRGPCARRCRSCRRRRRPRIDSTMNFFSGAEWCWKPIPASARIAEEGLVRGRALRKAPRPHGQDEKTSLHGLMPPFCAPTAPRSSASRSATSCCTDKGPDASPAPPCRRAARRRGSSGSAPCPRVGSNGAFEEACASAVTCSFMRTGHPPGWRWRCRSRAPHRWAWVSEAASSPSAFLDSRAAGERLRGCPARFRGCAGAAPSASA